MTYAYQWIPDIRALAPLTRDDVARLFGEEAVRKIERHHSRHSREVVMHGVASVVTVAEMAAGRVGSGLGFRRWARNKKPG